MNSFDTTIFVKRRNFLGVLLITSIIGVLLISLAVYRSSRELEIIHEVDNMSRIVPSLLGQETIEQMLRGESPSAPNVVFGDSAYRFYIVSKDRFRALRGSLDRESGLPEGVDLESTRVHERGGYFEVDGKIFTWARLASDDANKQLLVMHTFASTGIGSLVHVYKRRIIIPVIFYLWLMVWLSLILNYLLERVKNQQDQMKRMALHDSLTGLPNRNLMETRLLDMIRTSRRENKRFAFALIDLDGFKGINDRYGHVYGDELLRQAGKRLEHAMRGSDTAARLGGDEFTVLMSDLDDLNCHAALSHILSALIAPYTLFDTHASISASIGVSIYPVHGDDADTLLHHADQAMYKAKADGGGIRLFEPESESARQAVC